MCCMVVRVLCSALAMTGSDGELFGYTFDLDVFNCAAPSAANGSAYGSGHTPIVGALGGAPAATATRATNETTTHGLPWASRLSRCWYELGGAVLANTILGDAAVINLVIDGILKPDYLLPLHLFARFAPTQELMDDACRMTNVLYLPFRAQLLVKALCLTVRSYPRGPHIEGTFF